MASPAPAIFMIFCRFLGLSPEKTQKSGNQLKGETNH